MKKLYQYVQLLLHTGMRPSEGAGLINGNWRVIFRIVGEDVELVDYQGKKKKRQQTTRTYAGTSGFIKRSDTAISWRTQ